MKNITLGIVAHVDSGKTTLSEAILYNTGVLKEYGRVDNGSSFLDNDSLERKRGITIFSKQANFTINDTYISLIDTPGHVDFAPEMERTLQVLDYAILVISASDGIRPHTRTLWKLLKAYDIPTLIFINKMDQPDSDKNQILGELKSQLSYSCVDFSIAELNNDFLEEIALLSSETDDSVIFESFIETGVVDEKDICQLISKRTVFPVFFGSALKREGIDLLLRALDRYTISPDIDKDFGGIIYKITKDSQGNRLAHIKVTSGELCVKDVIGDGEKINQLRIYSGDKYESVNKVEAGKVCTALGISNLRAGDGLGINKGNKLTLIEPVLSYVIICPDGVSKKMIFPQIKALEDEYPELYVQWDESNGDILVKLMGEIQIEILSEIIKSRLGFAPEFDSGRITYKETIEESAYGVGHFEPLRHYAEVHLKIEPAQRGSGISYSSECSEDILDKNWQRLITTHIKEKKHLGVLTGSELTDVHISIVAGKAHNKHTEGGDFRQATYRAIRNGLMYAKNILLEPYYEFTLTVPSDMIGRAMTDLDGMFAVINPPETASNRTILTGRVPVSTMRNYQIKLNAYTHGEGHLACCFCGYDLCHNSEEVVETLNYNPEEDLNNPASSVFCSHGSGVIVPWYKVRDCMHVESDVLKTDKDTTDFTYTAKSNEKFDYSIGLDEIDEILSKTYNANQRSDKNGFKKKKSIEQYYSHHVSYRIPDKKLILVDGYNVIFAWTELKELADTNINSAKDRLINILSNYMSIIEGEIMVVFDGYKVQDNKGEETITEGITVVHTREGQTADQYIEAFTGHNNQKYRITVVSSDNLIQKITGGHNCFVLSSREFLIRINESLDELRKKYNL